VRRALLLPSLVLALTACEEEQILTADPEVHLCPAVDAATPVCDRAFDLGERAITVTHLVPFAITNRGRAPLGVEEIRATVDWIEVPFEPTILNNGDGVELLAEVTPTELGENRGFITVLTDDPVRPEATLELVLEGIPKPVPKLELCYQGACELGVDTFTVDFGTVRRTQEIAEQVIVRNAGDEVLELDDVVVAELTSQPGEISVESSTRAGSLEPGEEAPLVLLYAPADALADSATLTFVSNDPLVPRVDVIVTGTSDDNAPPTAIAAQLDTELTAFEAIVGDNVVLDGARSTDPEGDPLRFEWSLEAPAGSFAELDDPGAGRVLFVPDVAGTYTASLTVFDSLDQASLSPAEAVVTVLPQAALRVRLRWAQGGDADLHLVPAGDPLFGSTDCHFGSPRPDVGVIADPADDPELVSDAEVSPGAEDLIFAQPADGVYEVYVQYFDPADRGSAAVTVDVIAFDQSPPIFSGTLTLPDECSLWHVGDVTFPAGTFLPGSTSPGVLCAP
jgi:hypothetical protein